jgi:hypothetical protein
MAHQNDLLRRVNQGISTAQGQLPGQASANFPASMHNAAPAQAHSPSAPKAYYSLHSNTAHPQMTYPQQHAMGHMQQAQPQRTPQASKSTTVTAANKRKTSPAFKVYKVGSPTATERPRKSTKPATQVPVKQSPVPLPPYVLAAMSSTPSSPASSPLNTRAAVRITGTPVPPPKTGYPSTPQTISPSPLNDTSPTQPLNTQSNVSSELHSAGITQGQGWTHNPRPANHAPAPSSDERDAQQALSQLSQQYQGPQALAQGKMVTESQPVADPQPMAMEGVFPTQAESTQALTPAHSTTQEFPDVPGRESMQFVERMMQNLRRG